MEQTPDFKPFLESRWIETYKSSDAKFFFRGDIEKVDVKRVGSVFALCN